jgi:hypothetical protein
MLRDHVLSVARLESWFTHVKTISYRTFSLFIEESDEGSRGVRVMRAESNPSLPIRCQYEKLSI